MFFKIILHTINPPKSSSKDNIFAKFIQTINRHLIKHFQETVRNIGFLILIISKKNLKVDFRLIEFEFDLFDRNNKFLFFWRDDSIVILDITQFLVSDFGENLFAYIRIHIDKLLTNDFIYAGWSSIYVDVISE